MLHRIPPKEIDQHGRTGLGLHPSRCFQPCKCFNATIFDQHVLNTRESCDLAMVTRVYLLDSARLQRHPTSSDQVPPDSAARSVVSANVTDVHRFHVFLQHSLLLSCHCRFVLEHRSSSLGNVIEFPSSCALLESTRSAQLLRLIVQQASANKTRVSTNVCLS